MCESSVLSVLRDHLVPGGGSQIVWFSTRLGLTETVCIILEVPLYSVWPNAYRHPLGMPTLWAEDSTAGHVTFDAGEN